MEFYRRPKYLVLKCSNNGHCSCDVVPLAVCALERMLNAANKNTKRVLSEKSTMENADVDDNEEVFSAVCKGLRKCGLLEVALFYLVGEFCGPIVYSPSTVTHRLKFYMQKKEPKFISMMQPLCLRSLYIYIRISIPSLTHLNQVDIDKWIDQQMQPSSGLSPSFSTVYANATCDLQTKITLTKMIKLSRFLFDLENKKTEYNCKTACFIHNLALSCACEIYAKWDMSPQVVLGFTDKRLESAVFVHNHMVRIANETRVLGTQREKLVSSSEHH